MLKRLAKTQLQQLIPFSLYEMSLMSAFTTVHVLNPNTIYCTCDTHICLLSHHYLYIAYNNILYDQSRS